MPKYYEMELELMDVEPRIWRRLLMPADATLNDLGAAVVDACDWSGAQPQTIIKGQPATAAASGVRVVGEPSPEVHSLPPAGDPDVTQIDEYFEQPPAGEVLSVYGRRAQWWVRVAQTGVVSQAETFARRLLAGERTFPHECCRNIDESRLCAEYVRSGKMPRGLSPSTADKLGRWHPDRFDLEKCKRVFDRGPVVVDFRACLREHRERERLATFREDLAYRALGMFDHAVIGAVVARGAVKPWHSILMCPPEDPMALVDPFHAKDTAEGAWGCPSTVHVWLDRGTSQAAWRCEVCGRGGKIGDVTGQPVVLPEVEDVTRRTDLVNVPVSAEQHQELAACAFPYPEALDIVIGAQFRKPNVLLSAPRERMKLLCAAVCQGLIDARGQRKMKLEEARDRMEDALW